MFTSKNTDKLKINQMLQIREDSPGRHQLRTCCPPRLECPDPWRGPENHRSQKVHIRSYRRLWSCRGHPGDHCKRMVRQRY